MLGVEAESPLVFGNRLIKLFILFMQVTPQIIKLGHRECARRNQISIIGSQQFPVEAPACRWFCWRCLIEGAEFVKMPFQQRWNAGHRQNVQSRGLTRDVLVKVRTNECGSRHSAFQSMSYANG